MAFALWRSRAIDTVSPQRRQRFTQRPRYQAQTGAGICSRTPAIDFSTQYCCPTRPSFHAGLNGASSILKVGVCTTDVIPFSHSLLPGERNTLVFPGYNIQNLRRPFWSSVSSTFLTPMNSSAFLFASSFNASLLYTEGYPTSISRSTSPPMLCTRSVHILFISEWALNRHSSSIALNVPFNFTSSE